uniref:DUF4817 domain-containing protein n=1 Tax=Amphimedon queenslandica TaxID=400682 RepID=A0A1X7UWE7_AMPQE
MSQNDEGRTYSTPNERARIEKYAAENGKTRACRHFSQLWKRNIPEPTARHFKNEYLDELKRQRNTGKPVESIPTKQKGRPPSLSRLDTVIQEFIESLRLAGILVNTAITLAAAEGIIKARLPGKLQSVGGDIRIGKD